MTTVKTPKVLTGITPETTACFIEAIANDKAARIAALAKSMVVFVTTPEWARAEELRALFGLPRNQLMEWAASGTVVAKKCNPGLAGAAVLFKVDSVRKAIGDLCDYRNWLKKRPDREDKGGNGKRRTAR